MYRKILPEIAAILDDRLPAEITNLILPDLLEHPKKISKMFDVIEESWFTERCVDFKQWTSSSRLFMRSYTVYTCGVEKRVDRCSVCGAIQKVSWDYYADHHKVLNPYEQLWESTPIYYRDCEYSGHGNDILVGERSDVMVGIDGIRFTHDGVQHYVSGLP
nr:hypothetical protein K-LCC10_0483 [Kaumoebavirus]